MSGYRENPPAFAADFDAVIIVAEEIAFRDVRPIIPERITGKLRERGMHSALLTLGTRDPLAFMSLIAESASTYLSKVDEVYRELEQTWLVENPPQPRVGLRELVLHLSASGVSVAFVSSKSVAVARSAIQIGLKLTTGYTVVGRQEYLDTPNVLRAALKSAIETYPSGTRCIVLAHRKIATHGSLDTITSNLIQVGSSSREGSADASDPRVDIVDLAIQCDLMNSESAKLSKARTARDRILELHSKERLTSAELAELGDLTGSLRNVSNANSFGFANQDVGYANARRIKFTRTLAAKGQHLLEVVSIDATLIEIELRNWLIIHRSREFQPTDRITFGQTVALAESNGFPGDLVTRLRTFNSLRNDAVHHLARGVSSYDDLMDQYMADCVLLFDIEDFVHESAPIIGIDTSGLYP
ncbi:hypothetical protein [Nocardia sp. NPDC005366]|uniref:hypothetical protein n=1 Tax=Nocardia sp. NPDC005366 TaxID=3156878 RepID=UPI0033AB85A6